MEARGSVKEFNNETVYEITRETTLEEIEDFPEDITHVLIHKGASKNIIQDLPLHITHAYIHCDVLETTIHTIPRHIKRYILNGNDQVSDLKNLIAQDAIDVILSHNAGVKVIKTPFCTKPGCTCNYNASIEFNLAQLISPTTERPTKTLSDTCDRSRIKNSITLEEEKRFISSERGTEKNTQYAKKTSYTLLPSNARMHLYDNNSPIMMVVDLRYCYMKHFVVPINETDPSIVEKYKPQNDFDTHLFLPKYIFPTNIQSNGAPHLSGQKITLNLSSLSFDEQRKNNDRLSVETEIPKHNELLLCPSADGLRALASRVDALADRLNLQRVRDLFKATLAMEIPLLVIVPAKNIAQNCVREYSAEQQQRDLALPMLLKNTTSFVAKKLVEFLIPTEEERQQFITELLNRDEGLSPHIINYIYHSNKPASCEEVGKDLLNLIQYGLYDAAIALINKRPYADINVKLPDDNNTALHYAVQQRHLNLIKLLCYRNAPFEKNDLGKTPFEIALEARDSEILKIFLIYTQIELPIILINAAVKILMSEDAENKIDMKFIFELNEYSSAVKKSASLAFISLFIKNTQNTDEIHHLVQAIDNQDSPFNIWDKAKIIKLAKNRMLEILLVADPEQESNDECVTFLNRQRFSFFSATTSFKIYQKIKEDHDEASLLLAQEQQKMERWCEKYCP